MLFQAVDLCSLDYFNLSYVHYYVGLDVLDLRLDFTLHEVYKVLANAYFKINKIKTRVNEINR